MPHAATGSMATNITSSPTCFTIIPPWSTAVSNASVSNSAMKSTSSVIGSSCDIGVNPTTSTKPTAITDESRSLDCRRATRARRTAAAEWWRNSVPSWSLNCLMLRMAAACARACRRRVTRFSHSGRCTASLYAATAASAERASDDATTRSSRKPTSRSGNVATMSHAPRTRSTSAYVYRRPDSVDAGRPSARVHLVEHVGGDAGERFDLLGVELWLEGEERLDLRIPGVLGSGGRRRCRDRCLTRRRSAARAPRARCPVLVRCRCRCARRVSGRGSRFLASRAARATCRRTHLGCSARPARRGRR